MLPSDDARIRLISEALVKDSAMIARGDPNKKEIDKYFEDLYGLPHSCQTEMFWNWDTIDACFLTPGWQIRSSQMFAATCFGVILLTFALEFFRKRARQYDRYLIKKLERRDNEFSQDRIRLAMWEQAIRAALFLLQVVTAYLLILLAVSFNGYIILCIFLGSFLAFYTFQWDAAPFKGMKGNRKPQVIR
ncbi:Ctr copper transporter family-domain-containing protein [Podospora australis]|uniref:Copper transport protein n=1 Tax=Podospora australis TaxID=1536484 RepID=A0AAN6X354_9PEZI|nr:Ctr copper transporter family-domain-containing protein [Podospora australis]